MGNFYCKLHLLANFASETDKVLKEFESLILHQNYSPEFVFATKESGVARLVRTTCKAFHSRGSDEAGVASYFNSFLFGKKEKSLLIPFIGNRFNVLYYNAATVYYHRDSMLEFLENWPNPNNLLKAVKEDLSNTVFVAELRALGIVDKLLTGLLWRLIEEKKNILELNPYLFRLKLKLDELGKNASPLLDQVPIFPDLAIHKDGLYDKLFDEINDAESCVLTQQALEVILMGILVILERQCVYQLPGGKYWNAELNLSTIGKNVPTTNKASESDFAILDMLIRAKPNSTIQTLQALTMWMRNDTAAWLNCKSLDEKTFLLDKVRKLAPIVKKKYMEKVISLRKEKEDRLLEKQKLKKESEEKEIMRKINAANSLISLNVKAWASFGRYKQWLKQVRK